MDDVPEKNDEDEHEEGEDNVRYKEDNDEEKCKVVDDEAIEQQVKALKGCMAPASLLQEYKVTTSEDVNIRLIWWAVFRGDRCGSNLVGLV